MVLRMVGIFSSTYSAMGVASVFAAAAAAEPMSDTENFPPIPVPPFPANSPAAAYVALGPFSIRVRTSRSIILPSGPVGVAYFASTPVFAARALARGDTPMNPSAERSAVDAAGAAITSVAGAAASALGASAGAAAAGAESAGLNSSVLSPGFPITQTLVIVFTSASSSKKMSSITPSTGDSSSRVDLSVS